MPGEMTSTTFSMPHCAASATAWWIRGVPRTGNSAFGTERVTGRNLVPSPATGITAVRIFPDRLVIAIGLHIFRIGAAVSVVRFN